MGRSLWLTTGMAVGAAGALWSRRRIGQLSERARAGALPGDLSRLAHNGAERVGRRVAGAVDTGRAEADRRRQELRRLAEGRR